MATIYVWSTMSYAYPSFRKCLKLKLEILLYMTLGSEFVIGPFRNTV